MKEIALLNKEHGNIESSLQYFLSLQIGKDAQILDIGCRYGSLIYNLYQLGYHRVYGLDIDEKSLQIGKKAFPEIADRIAYYNGEKIPFAGETFDVVLMFDVIEHIPKIKRFLQAETHRILKKDGLLIFQTPNKFINIPWEVISQRSLTGWRRYHCSLQTLHSLRNILVESGYSHISIEKHTVLTEHNQKKVVKNLGSWGIVLLKILAGMPLVFYPNFWGRAKKQEPSAPA